jgi:hypothetical protein
VVHEEHRRKGPAVSDDLLAIGLRAGEQVRFRKVTGGQWQLATVVGRAKDGSVALRDAKGAARNLPIDRLEVRTSGPRGAVTWEPVPARAARSEQLHLL